jgi:hypothetical protein
MNVAITGLPDGIFSNQKFPIEVNFGGPCNGRCWHHLWPFGLCILVSFGKFCGHLVCLVVIGYIIRLLGIISPVLVYCTKKNLAPLVANRYIFFL